MSHKPSIARGLLSGLSTEELTYKITIHENGKLDLMEKVGPACEVAGDEFNPLAEFDKNGQPNPYQDPSRGRFQEITSADDGTASIDSAKFLLQNIIGKDGINGRSLKLTEVAEDGTETVVSCCIIGRDEIPDLYKPPAYPYYKVEHKSHSNRREHHLHFVHPAHH